MNKVLRITEPLNRDFTAHGCFAVRADEPSSWISNGVPSQSRVVLSGPKYKLLEVAALVPAGTTEVSFEPGEQQLGNLLSPNLLVTFLRFPLFRLKIEGHNGDIEIVNFTGGHSWMKGPVRRGNTGVVHTNKYGSFRWWTVANANDRRVWMTLRWMNSVRADGTARSEFLFRSLSIQGLRHDVTWSGAVPDPSINLPYLVKPSDHVFPQMGMRDFRLVFYEKSNPVPNAPDGWGTGDWSEGGWLPAGLKIPALGGAAVQEVTRRANDERTRFRNLAGTGGAEEAPRLSWLWPYAGVTYGGMTGEIDIWPYDGVLTASTALRAGLDMHRILSIRYGLRQRLIFEADGTPVVPENHLVGGQADWSMYDFAFQQQWGADGGTNDNPWQFDKQSRPDGPRAYDPSVCMPIDLQHLIRAIKDARALIWLDGDPAACEYVTCIAEHARMTFWHKQGRARRYTLPEVAGIGAAIGRADAWSGCAIVVAQMLGRPNMNEWLSFFKQICEIGTTPCGLFAAMNNGKAADTPPFNSLYRVQRGNEMSYFAQLFDEMVNGAGFDMESLQNSFRHGIRGMAWRPGYGGCWDRHTVGIADGSVMYEDRTEVPAGIYDPAVLESWQYYVGNIVGPLDIPELYNEWKQSVGINPGRIVDNSGAPIEIWLPALSRWGGNIAE